MHRRSSSLTIPTNSLLTNARPSNTDDIVTRKRTRLKFNSTMTASHGTIIRTTEEELEAQQSLPFKHQRILIYATCYNVIDGVSLTIRKIEQEILSAGGHVAILTTRSGNPKNTNINGTHPNRRIIFLDNSIPIPFVGDGRELGFSLSNTIKTQIANFQPTIIHMTLPDCVALNLLQYARSSQIPIMGTHHSNISEYMHHYPGMKWLAPIVAEYFRHFFNFLQALYVTTPYMHSYLADTYSLDRITELNVWGRGIDLEKFSPKHRSLVFRRRFGIGSDEVVICFVSRLVREKRLDIVAGVIQKLYDNNIPFKALIVGAGPEEERMKSLPNTICTGWMAGDELSIAYASSDIFLFPSAVETFGNVTLEAAASGLPLVVEAGCSGHLVTNGCNGYGCEAGDFNAFYAATLTLLTNTKMRKEFALHSREMSYKYENRKIMQDMLANYSKVYDDFYGKYGGRHCNRDECYQNENSFLAGMHPRPASLVVIETVFVRSFQFLVFLYTAYNRIKTDVFAPFCRQCRTKRCEVASAIQDDLVEITTQELPVIANDLEEEKKEDDMSLSMKYMSPSASASDLADGYRNQKPPVPLIGLHSDSEKRGTKVSFGDSEFAYRLSILFVNTVAFVWKAESRIRTMVEKYYVSSSVKDA